MQNSPGNPFLNRRLVEPLGLAAHVFVLTTFALMLAWILGYLGGVSHHIESGKYFNLHPLLNSFGFLLLLGEAVLVYRTVPLEHGPQKVMHGVMQAGAFAFGVAAVVVVNRWKTFFGFEHWYSVHSWIGLVLLSLIGLQWLFGLFVLLMPGAADEDRRRYVPVHRFFGIAILCFAYFALLTGVLNQQRLLPMHESKSYYGNVVGVFMLATFLLLLFTIYPWYSTAYDVDAGSVLRDPSTVVVPGGRAATPGEYQSHTHRIASTTETAAV